jgi:hypothetical protein
MGMYIKKQENQIYFLSEGFGKLLPQFLFEDLIPLLYFILNCA